MFNLFKKKDTQKPNNLCSINFTLSYDGIITTELFWPDFDENNNLLIDKVSQDFGALIYLLMNGSMNSDIFSTIDEAKTNHATSKYDKKFIDSLENYLFVLKTLNNTSLTKNSPLIPPSLVFKNAHTK